MLKRALSIVLGGAVIAIMAFAVMEDRYENRHVGDRVEPAPETVTEELLDRTEDENELFEENSSEYDNN